MGFEFDRQLVELIQPLAEASGVFAGVRAEDRMLICDAKGCEAEASYRIEWDEKGLWVSFATPDRWLSESIEADLMHTGDKLEGLIEEELVERGLDTEPSFEHFRSEDLLFTFRTPIPVPPMIEAPDFGVGEFAQLVARYLLAYEACFRELGDVAGSEDES